MVWGVDGDVRAVYIYRVPDTRRMFRREQRNYWMDWSVRYDLSTFQDERDRNPGAIQTLEIYQTDLIPHKKAHQYFRDGIDHCVFKPIENWAQSLLDEARRENPNRKDRTTQRYGHYIKTCRQLATV